MRLNRLSDQQAATMPPMYRLIVAARLRMEWLRQRYLLLVGVLTMSLAVAGTAYYWSSARFVLSTDNAYVQDPSMVTSRVSGCVSAAMMENHQSAKSAQMLVPIDERSFRAALDQARTDDHVSRAAVDDLPIIRSQIDGHMLDLVRAARDAGSVSAMDLLSVQSQLEHVQTLRSPAL